MNLKSPAAAPDGERPQPIPVILDTDIGSDIDDTWALVMLLRCPELDVRLITTCRGDAPARAKLVARMLEVMGRTDIPIGIGPSAGVSPGSQIRWVEGYDLARYPGTVYPDGAQALVDTVLASPVPPAVIAIGPLTTVAAALERDPSIAERARFVGMHGSIRVGYEGSPTPVPEANVRNAPQAAQRVFGASWPKTITPLDTCGLIRIEGERYARVHASDDPVILALLENYRLWLRPEAAGQFDQASSVLFDTVAVYLAFAEDLVRMETLPIRVTDEGCTVEDPSGSLVRCAMAWNDLDAYLDLLVARLLGENG